MGEWLKPAVLKTVDAERCPGVRIPLPPPFYPISMEAVNHNTSSFSEFAPHAARTRMVQTTDFANLGHLAFGGGLYFPGVPGILASHK
jgi:hypothetical protein